MNIETNPTNVYIMLSEGDYDKVNSAPIRDYDLPLKSIASIDPAFACKLFGQILVSEEIVSQIELQTKDSAINSFDDGDSIALEAILRLFEKRIVDGVPTEPFQVVVCPTDTGTDHSEKLAHIIMNVKPPAMAS